MRIDIGAGQLFGFQALVNPLEEVKLLFVK